MRGESLVAKLERLTIPEPNTGCLLWLGSMNYKGYGTLRGSLAHRVFYADAHGPIPPGLEINHRCQQRSCVNVTHLEAVTHTANIAYSVVKRTHCKRGHELSGDNLFVYPSTSPQAGARRCWACWDLAAEVDLERKRARRHLAS